FSQTNDCPAPPQTLAHNAFCTITFTMSPVAPGGAASSSVKVTDTATGSPQTISVRGTGIAPVTLTPTSLAFGSINLFESSAAKTITLKNNQSSALTINSILSAQSSSRTA